MKKPGRHADGATFISRFPKPARASPGAGRSSIPRGKQREAGFGSCGAITLAEAREKAAGFRSMLAKGIDPLDAKKAARRPRRRAKPSASAPMNSSNRSVVNGAPRYTRRNGAQRSTITAGLFLTSRSIRSTRQAVLGVLQPLWQRIPETASRLRGRIEAVFDYAKAHKLRSGENPAAWRGHLALILPKRAKLTRGHHAAMHYAEVPVFIAKLREGRVHPGSCPRVADLDGGRPARFCLRTWDEIDVDAKVWVYSASRMKAGREHRVPLSPRAVEIVERAWLESGPAILCFRPAARRPLSDWRWQALSRRRHCSRFGRPSAIGRAKKELPARDCRAGAGALDWRSVERPAGVATHSKDGAN